MNNVPANNFMVRPATSEDAEGVKAVHMAGWRAAYHHVLPKDFLADLENFIDAERWRRELSDPAVISYVATTTHQQPQVVGWLTAGAPRDEVAPIDLELMGLYITEQWYGTGVAHALVQQAIGTQAAYLWVLKDNPRAQAFYRKEGFELDGVEQTEPMGPSQVVVARMTRGESS